LTSKSDPRIFSMVLAFAGDSTISKFFAIFSLAPRIIILPDYLIFSIIFSLSLHQTNAIISQRE